MKKVLSAALLPTMMFSSVATLNCSASKPKQPATVSQTQNAENGTWSTKAKAVAGAAVATAGVAVAGTIAYKCKQAKQIATKPAKVSFVAKVSDKAKAAGSFCGKHWKKIAGVAGGTTGIVVAGVALKKWGPECPACIKNLPQKVADLFRKAPGNQNDNPK